MDLKYFNSSLGWFECTYPSNWTAYEEENGTYLFLDNDDWKGNFRISPIRLEKKDKLLLISPVQEYLEAELIKNKGAKKVILGNRQAVVYTKEIIEGKDNLTVTYWIIGDNSTVLICSFTIDTDQTHFLKIKDEIQNTERVLETIRINNAR